MNIAVPPVSTDSVSAVHRSLEKDLKTKEINSSSVSKCPSSKNRP
jgi:hypothetical protein